MSGRKQRDSSDYPDRVTARNPPTLNDTGVEAPQALGAPEVGVEDLERVDSEPAHELAATEVRLRGHLDHRIADLEPGSGREVASAQVEIDVELIARRRPRLQLGRA